MTKWISALGVLVLAFGCMAAPDEASTEAALRGGNRVAETYVVRPDFRRCVSPLCGGYWVSSVNRAETVCPDRTAAAECYVAEVDFSGLGLPASQVETLYAGGMLIEGRLRRQRYPGFGRLGVLSASDAWRPANDAAPASGTFFTVADNGIRCITTPCFSMDGTALNTGAVTTFTGFDLSSVSDDPALWEAFNDGGLRVAGVGGPDGFGGTALVASQAWTHIDPVECVADAECAMSAYHSYVRNRGDCYCPFCPQAISQADAEVNEASYRRYCADQICPAVRCAYPGDAACIAGSCGAVFPE